MPLTTEHKLGLLMDLLQNEISEQYMTSHEKHQLLELLITLKNESSLREETLQTINEIQGYSFDHPWPHADVENWLNTFQNQIDQ
ncbi:YtzH-like family protein [Alkalihalobacillus sp. 1P02AB]|uniref:YtzH-like family protein n=1 Tax=Alkalihalobacillus sp. 1P02AB TaxID=3132260 RepID=UPI0039A43FE2